MAVAKNRVAALRQKMVALRRTRELDEKRKADEARRAKNAGDAAVATAALAGGASTASSGSSGGSGRKPSLAPTFNAASGASGPRIPGRIVASYSAVKPGPLPAHHAKTYAGGRYDTVELEEDVVVYRVWHPKGAAGADSAQEFGQYWTTQKPAGALQTRMNAALLPEWGNLASVYTAIRIPRGTKIYVGEASAQGGAWIGGGPQVIIDGGPKAEWKVEEGVLK